MHFLEWTALEAYSMDLRVRVMADVDGGLGMKAAAEKYRVSADWIRKLKRLRRETGSFAPRQQRVSHATKLDKDLPRLEQLVKQRPDATLKELRAALGCEASISCIWRALRRLQFTFKKSDFGCRTKATRCAGATQSVASPTARLARGSPGVHRRDRIAHQPSAALWTSPTRAASDRPYASRPLEDDHVCFSTASRSINGTHGRGRRYE